MERRRFNRRKSGRIAVALGLGFMLGTWVRPPDANAPERVLPPTAQVLAEAVPLDSTEPGRRRVGGLTYLEGYRLSSRDIRFGGISAMHIEGGRVVALSDAGTVFRFALPRQAGALPVAIERLPRGPGTGRRKSDRDAESLVVHGGSAWIGFEGRNSIWRYRLADWRFQSAAAPDAMRDWPSNGGSEAMVRLADGRFLVFAEGNGDAPTSPALLFPGDPAAPGVKPVALRYRPPPEYRITDAAQLPDGRLLFLNRRATLMDGFSAILTVTDGPPRLDGTVIEGRVLAALAAPLTVDNMEALSVGRERARTVIWIASDDNLDPLLQETLLLKFAVE